MLRGSWIRNGQVIRKRIAELQLELGTQTECNASIPASTGGSDYDCSVFPPTAFSPYILPWQIGESRVANPHIARGDSGTQRDAIDVPMPIGTQVFAIRSGVNFVLVWHDDGTVARHAHLTFMGAIVQLGDGVRAGTNDRVER